ncbi:MAG: hypothetical protein KDB00_02405 [Planctomycetales bacterium]|nr:hypothetical protein [Planctomycetales bacterium]
MSSSNRSTSPCDAAVYRDEKPVGPLRLPMEETASFVEEFNRVYRQVGIAIAAVKSEVQTKVPSAD